MNHRKIIEAKAIIHEAVALHNPTHIFGLFSGGHDSLCATHIACQHFYFQGAVHINTGVGVEETRDFVRQTCKDQKWTLKEYSPPVSYDDIVLEHGFPGPGGHFYMYIRLKERCVAQLIKDHKRDRDERILLVTGVRLDESERRMGHVDPIVRQGARVWVAPILNWTTDDKNDYININTLPRNPVVNDLCMSGECLCGAFARPGEMAEIEMFYPKTAERIHDLERRALERGVHAKWGTRPPKGNPEIEDTNEPLPMELCWSCEAKRATAQLSDELSNSVKPGGFPGEKVK
jgi:3'-phosphoadenosine 5'-phosphosulfate sulfotransferase (PAPS reductase)/FAD synthetase